MLKKYTRIKNIMLECNTDAYWPWLSDAGGKLVSKKAANKFMLGAIMDYQMKAEQVWENARILSEERLGDPDDLWGVIARKSEKQFKRIFCHPSSLHKFKNKMPERIFRISQDLVKEYKGDARKIWKGQSTDEVMKRLHKLRVGVQLTRMIRGALVDTNQINGKGELKADLNVRRVLGRVFKGESEISQDEALRIANQMVPGDSWKLDGFLYAHGKSVCIKSRPRCDYCVLKDDCKYGRRALAG